MMADNESVLSAMDKTDTPSHSVDYYYLEAMRYLKCEASHHSEESEEDEGHHCSCSKCRAEVSPGGGGAMDDAQDADLGGRERSWSHSMANDRESGTISELPVIDGKFGGNRMRNRRFSDGMLLKQNMKVSDGHVHWADECKRELTRFRPRKQYTRRPSVTQTPIKSILKNGSEESLVLHQDNTLDDSDSCSGSDD